MSTLDRGSGAEAKALLPITILGDADMRSQVNRRPNWYLASKVWAAKNIQSKKVMNHDFAKTRKGYNKFLFGRLKRGSAIATSPTDAVVL